MDLINLLIKIKKKKIKKTDSIMNNLSYGFSLAHADWLLRGPGGKTYCPPGRCERAIRFFPNAFFFRADLKGNCHEQLT